MTKSSKYKRRVEFFFASIWWRTISDERGNILLLSVVLSALVLAITASLFYFNSPQKLLESNYVHENSSQLRDSLASLLASQEAWIKTVDDPSNGNLSTCVNGDCSALATGEHMLVTNAVGEVVFDGTQASPKSGYDYSGKSCAGFDSVNGNSGCPFAYEIIWQAVRCPPDCVKAKVQVTGRLLYRPGSSSAWDKFNLKKYEVIYVR